MFKFRFQSLLQLAISQRDTARSSLAEALEALERLQQQRQQLAEARRSLISDPQVARVGTMRLDGLLAQGRYERQLAIETAQLVAAEAQIELEIERRRLTLQRADMELRRLELLRDRDRLGWDQRQSKAEQTMLDEIAARLPGLSAIWPDSQETER
jgi:flagellar export protein FliJ